VKRDLELEAGSRAHYDDPGYYADTYRRRIDDGPTLYKGVRSEIEFYFGQALVAELDGLERGG
jgi:hypothetical protein